MTTAPFKAFGVSLVQASSSPCGLLSIDGFYNGPGGEFLQLHNSPSTPAAGSVPVKSFYLALPGTLPSIFAALATLDYSMGLFIGISSTSGTYTASASVMDIFGDITNVEPVPNYSESGDTATAIAALSVWTTANGPKFIHNIVATNATGGATQYLQLHVTDSPSNGDTALRSWALVDGTTKTISFGRDGFSPRVGGNKGCRLVVSSTPGVLTTVAGTPWRIYVQYL